MGNKLTAAEEPPSGRFVKPSKRRSRSQSEGVTSDCGTAVTNSPSDKAGGMPLPTTEEEASASDRSDRARRIREAERILLEIANEYAAKRAAGLVPTKPVPARTLLWEEMERRARRGVGRRGVCVFGRDSADGPCGCATYKKLSDDAGGVCACCSHGAPWHRLTGGTMSVNGGSSSMTRSRGSRSRASSRNSQAPIDSSMYSLGSDYYDEYDAEYDSESDEDDEDIANEVAKPYGVMGDPTPPLTHSHARSEGDALDRSSLFSNGDSFGLPPRLSSTSRHLDKLLSAIAKYRQMGMSEEEIEVKIREDFPPTERLSNGGNSPRPTRASR
ncbi:hypothetical protein PRIC1_002797 [Phytophthora ramorum]|uniref:Uncharacterized protein n=1 Tax=Phytophthora ramorum TaxID=164328 RepID=H3GGP9_PHYRM|nr:hypothetical protein KRP23_712 [Phytophthora ramorum]